MVDSREFGLSVIEQIAVNVHDVDRAVENRVGGLEQRVAAWAQARQAAFSYAYAFSDKMFSIGVTGKFLQGAAYRGDMALTGGNDVKITDNFGKPTISTAFGIDVGAIYRPSSWLRFGLVAKDINQPTFDAPGGGELALHEIADRRGNHGADDHERDVEDQCLHGIPFRLAHEE